jgi:hypothetical protein
MNATKIESVIKTVSGIDEVIEFMRAWDFGREPLKIKVHGAGKTLDYKSVFWIWMRSITEQYVLRKMPDFDLLDKEGKEMHMILCKRHLGVLPAKTISKTQFNETTRTITYPKDLDKGEWFHFLQGIEEDCKNMGFTLPEKVSQYSEDKARSVA